jgi:anti-sigma regulatory factor (Ser/Thr protein kinase)
VTTAPYRRSAIEAQRPRLELDDPTPVQARRALVPLAEAAGLQGTDVDDLRSAVSEVVTNAVMYGTAPVRVTGWAAPGRVVVTVSDCGQGPSETDLGLAPLARDAGQGGLGLWMARQLCDELVMGRFGDGFTVRLVLSADADR